MPIYSWEKAKETHNTSFLKEENLHVNPKSVEKDKDKKGEHIFLGMLTEIFDEFGLNKDLQEELKIKKDLVTAYLDFSETGDRSLLNAVNIHKKKLTDRLSKFEEKTIKFGEEMAIVSKNLGTLIDPKTTTVYQYYSAKTISNNG